MEKGKIVEIGRSNEISKYLQEFVDDNIQNKVIDTLSSNPI